MKVDLISQARTKLDRELLSIEQRTDLTDEQKVSQIIVTFSTVCAAIAVQPIPFADIFILTPLQAFMGTRISAVRGLQVTESEATDLIKELVAVVGMGMVAQQIGIGAAKIFFPIFGGVATIPVVFSLTYGIGKVMDAYFVSKSAGRPMSKTELKKAWTTAKAEGKQHARNRESGVEEAGRSADAPSSDVAPHKLPISVDGAHVTWPTWSSDGERLKSFQYIVANMLRAEAELPTAFSYHYFSQPQCIDDAMSRLGRAEKTGSSYSEQIIAASKLVRSNWSGLSEIEKSQFRSEA